MAIGGEFTLRLLRDAGIAERMRILDVGCGTGGVPLIAADLIGFGGSVLGIDRDARMVEMARERALGAGMGNIRSEVLDMDDLPAGSDPLWRLPAEIGRVRTQVRPASIPAPSCQLIQ
ncbi:methyltransferase domain-containing protein [Aurantimonas aggregata]|uniref:Methyltransferase domain-containing protein n=1 Tax=Aurantimonas aggregata TaxID=2047720 RepID=A0A6L9MCJ4_9HYPH|nr:methyltransferase domain-containing protein [Aurantimonas aggregata]